MLGIQPSDLNMILLSHLDCDHANGLKLVADYGKILNLSSVASFCAGPKMSLYYASKEFVRSFSEAVAEAGYKAMMKKKTLLYYGASTKLMNIGARILPRSISRKFAGKING